MLFRGKRVDNGEWVEGYLFKTKEHTYIAYAGQFDDDLFLSPKNIFIEVVPETVGQYTGLTDKNRKNIFKGDIVRLCDENNDTEWSAIVEFGNPNGEYNWGWQLKPIVDPHANKDILLWIEIDEFGISCEVIGNIHDNPKLLEVQK